jgi:phosphoribosylglycinamide formyltransferase 1
MKKIALFASGSGTNVQRIAEYFQNSEIIKVDCILSNNSKAFVLERAKTLNISSFVFSREDFYDSSKVIELLIERKIDLLVLAGFMWLVPQNLIDSYRNRIINIHPALLPKYGGKGMYGMYVHQSIIENKEPESGITIHYVNENYDEGNIILQAKCKVEKNDTPESLAQKIHKLEYEHYPKVIEEIIAQMG